jgi:hypothetical protein
MICPKKFMLPVNKQECQQTTQNCKNTFAKRLNQREMIASL